MTTSLNNKKTRRYQRVWTQILGGSTKLFQVILKLSCADVTPSGAELWGRYLPLDPHGFSLYEAFNTLILMKLGGKRNHMNAIY